MSLPSLLGLAQSLVALLLLAGAPVAAAEERPPAIELAQLQLQPHRPAALAPDDRGIAGGIAGIAGCADIDDDPEPLAVVPAHATAASLRYAQSTRDLAGIRLVVFQPWPCASLSTGPPQH